MSNYPPTPDWVDPQDETRPNLAYQETPRQVSWAEPRPPRRRRAIGCCFWLILLPVLVTLCLGAAYVLAPGRTNVLILGTDAREVGSSLGRSDTMILTTFVPAERYAGMLSIPRDLWVVVPGYGENRINTAHFFGEAYSPDSGPALAMETVRLNFGVDVHYYLRVRFDGLVGLVDALGGIELELPRAMSGYPAGAVQMDGLQALAFVRDRAGSDDFARIERGQIFLRGLFRILLMPETWVRLPVATPLALQLVDTDIPAWQWPQIGITLLLVGPENIDGRIITREMVFPFTTSNGAQVLAPNWDLINPVLLDMFNQ